MRSVNVIVRGTVQGVGFRAFVQREALRFGLDGWVRNRRDGTVEAVLSGGDSGIERMLMALRVGPPAAAVEDLKITAHEGDVAAGFAILRTE